MESTTKLKTQRESASSTLRVLFLLPPIQLQTASILVPPAPLLRPIHIQRPKIKNCLRMHLASYLPAQNLSQHASRRSHPPAISLQHLKGSLTLQRWSSSWSCLLTTINHNFVMDGEITDAPQQVTDDRTYRLSLSLKEPVEVQDFRNITDRLRGMNLRNTSQINDEKPRDQNT